MSYVKNASLYIIVFSGNKITDLSSYIMCDWACKFNHVSVNYTKLYFPKYLHFSMYYSVSVNHRRKLIKFYSSGKDCVVLV